MKKIFSRIVFVLLFAAVFVFFFNGYKAAGPSRSKFKKLGEGVEDLTQETKVVEVNQLKEMASDRHFKPWVGWWKRCIPDYSLDAMEDIGQAPLYSEDINFIPASQMYDGPSKMFYIKSPDGKKILNPYYKRLLLKKEVDGWQPYVEIPCGVALYTLQKNKAQNIMDCSALEGIDDAFWMKNNKIVLMGYSTVSRQMNVECETTESCISPTIWIMDLGTSTVNEHRGPINKRKKCELGGYLKVKLPDFFNEEKK